MSTASASLSGQFLVLYRQTCNASFVYSVMTVEIDLPSLISIVVREL